MTILKFNLMKPNITWLNKISTERALSQIRQASSQISFQVITRDHSVTTPDHPQFQLTQPNFLIKDRGVAGDHNVV